MVKSFEYDENGAIFGHFCIALVSFFLIPFTYYIIKFQLMVSNVIKTELTCKCHLCQENRMRIQLKNKKNSKKIILIIITIIAWLSFLYIALFLHNFKFKQKSIKYDPFTVLELERGASGSDIKAAYRKLVLIKHPDHGGDTEEYIAIIKAYKALTDDISRENYEKYGNPDGPSNPSFGIALPSWLIDSKYSRIVLLIYFLVMIVGMPTGLAIWWYRSKRHYSDKLLNSTIQLYSYFISKTPDLKWKRIITIVSGSEELSPKYSTYMAIKHSQAKDVAYLVSKTNVKQKKEGVFNQSFSVKARALIFAHLNRMPLPPSLKDDADKLYVQYLLLLSEFQSLVSTFIYQKMIGNITYGPTLDTFLMCIRLSSVVVQGLSVSDSSLMQLPHIDEEKVSIFQRRKKSLNTVQSFVDLNEKDTNFLLKGFSENQKMDIFMAIEAMPHLDIETALKVDDEINPVSIESLSIVSILIRINRTTLSKQFKFSIEINKNVPASCANSHVSPGLISQTPSGEKSYDWNSFSPEVKKKEPKYFAHAPYFPFTKKEGWWVYILDSNKKLTCIPVYFHFTQKCHQMVLQMFSSESVGLFTYKCYIVSDSYVDFNYQKEITMNVVKQQPLVTDHPQWQNDSDEEQDKVDSDVLTDSEEPIASDLAVA